MIRAVLWDFGGVITSSPFDAFARYEREAGLPANFIRGLNAVNHHQNAWARLERNEVGLDEFCGLYEAEALAAGHTVDARAVLGCLSRDLRPAMVRALQIIKANRFKQACLTNNFVGMASEDAQARLSVLDLFDVIVESSKIGVRKPEPAFYSIACAQLGVDATEAVMLDDLGVNLKTARDLGMMTIKVVDETRALEELESILALRLR